MPSRYYLRQFYPGTYHHIFNRGAYKQKVFLNQKDYLAFVEILKFYLKYPTGKSLTRIRKRKTQKSETTPYELIAYCLMPNHFHLLLKQNDESPTIADLLRRLSITYSMYFQEKHDHSGVLFQGRYKSVLVESGNQLLYLTKYIHLNPGKLAGSQPTYSSLTAYTDESVYLPWLRPDIIFNSFFENSPKPYKGYQEFLNDQSRQDTELIQPVKLD